MKRNAFIAILITAVIAQVALWLPLPLVAKSVAALLFTGFLPGLLLVEVWVGQSEAPPTFGEKLLYALAIGYGCMVIVMLGISYLPGGVKPWQTFLAFNLLLAFLVILTWFRTNRLLTTPLAPCPLPHPVGCSQAPSSYSSAAAFSASPTWAMPNFTAMRRAPFCARRV